MIQTLRLRMVKIMDMNPNIIQRRMVIVRGVVVVALAKVVAGVVIGVVPSLEFKRDATTTRKAGTCIAFARFSSWNVRVLIARISYNINHDNCTST